MDYSELLVDPAALPVPRVVSAPLPVLVEPEVQPEVVAPVDEPLVEVSGPGVVDLAAYFSAGWPHARGVSLARVSVVGALVEVAAGLPVGFGLAVLDGWRPLALQRAIFDAAYSDPGLPAGFVSVPSSDPATPPPHLTGGTVDVSLTWDGVPLALGTAFDDFTAAAHTAAFEGSPSLVRDLRRLLFWAMSAAGFVVIDCEWWHFELGTRRHAALRGGSPRFGAAAPDPTTPCCTPGPLV